jgi:hypothetical protein
MLRGHSGQKWRGTYDLYFIHHDNRSDLQRSADDGCCFCRVIWKEMERLDEELEQSGNAGSREQCFSTRANLSSVRGWDGVYRLDFKMKVSERHDRPVGTFVLKQSGGLAASSQCLERPLTR